jgi:hypothetical protein
MRIFRNIVIAASLALCACGVTTSGTPLASTSSLCARTVADEQGVIAFNLGYKAFRLAAETGVRSGFIKGTLAGQVRTINTELFTQVQNLDTVYRTCNGDLGAALAGANRLLESANKLIGGD